MTIRDMEQRIMDSIPDHIVQQIRDGEVTITGAAKKLARAQKEVATAHSPEELFSLLGIAKDAYFSDKKAALLGFAARQPGTIVKFPDEWVLKLKEDMAWPLDHELRAAITAGEAIRDKKFIRLGS